MIITTVGRTSDNSIFFFKYKQVLDARLPFLSLIHQFFSSNLRLLFSVILVCLQRNIENNWPVYMNRYIAGRQERNFTSINSELTTINQESISFKVPCFRNRRQVESIVHEWKLTGKKKKKNESYDFTLFLFLFPLFSYGINFSPFASWILSIRRRKFYRMTYIKLGQSVVCLSLRY